jgi:hypothetical protein
MTTTLLAVGDVVWLGVIGLFQAVLLAGIAFLVERSRQASEKGNKAAEESAKAAAKEVANVKSLASVAAGRVEEVKQALDSSNKASDKKLDGLAIVADKIHVLTNNNMQIALASNAKLARRIANESDSAEDKDVAEQAEDALEVHKGKQAVVDSGEGKTRSNP